MRVDGIEIGPILIRDFGLALDLTYQPYSARAARRVVTIDTVHGRCIDAPRYLRGHDDLTGQTLTFRLDRIETLHATPSTPQDRIPWFIGQLVRRRLGQPVMPPPEVFPVARPVTLSVRWGSRPAHRRDGVTTSAVFEYRDNGPVIVLAYDSQGQTHIAEAGEAAAGWRIEDWRDGVTGEEVSDHFGWLAGGPAAQTV